MCKIIALKNILCKACAIWWGGKKSQLHTRCGAFCTLRDVTHAHTYTHTHTHRHTHTRMHARTHTHTHMYTYTHTRTHTHARRQIHPCTHSHTHRRGGHTLLYTHTETQKHTYSRNKIEGQIGAQERGNLLKVAKVCADEFAHMLVLHFDHHLQNVGNVYECK